MNFLTKVKNFFFWGWKLRNSVDFDANSVYEILYLKLDRTYREFLANSHCVWNRSENTNGMKKLRIARELAKRKMEDKYTNRFQPVFEREMLFDLLKKHMEYWWD